jgi:hypothetical protein
MSEAIPDRLAALPAHDVSPRDAEQIRRRALAALAGERRFTARPWLSRARRAWNAFIEPAFAAGAVAVYLMWLVKMLAPLV